MDRKFSRPVQIRLTDQEYGEIFRQAEAKGQELGLPKLSVSDYVRWLINANKRKEEGR